MSAGTATGTCPFAARPDVTGCDCDCTLPRPKGFLASLAWWLTPSWCTSGAIGEGSGRLPCRKYDRWRKGERKMRENTENKHRRVKDMVREVLADQLCVEPEMVKDNADFYNDLGADTLDVVEFLIRLEERFGISIPDTDADKITTIVKTAAYLMERGVA